MRRAARVQIVAVIEVGVIAKGTRPLTVGVVGADVEAVVERAFVILSFYKPNDVFISFPIHAFHVALYDTVVNGNVGRIEDYGNQA